MLEPCSIRSGAFASRPFSAPAGYRGVLVLAVDVHASQRHDPACVLQLELQRRPVGGGDWEQVSALTWQGNSVEPRKRVHAASAFGPVLSTTSHTRARTAVGEGDIDWFAGHELRAVVTTPAPLVYSIEVEL